MASRMLWSVLLVAAMLSLCGPAVAQDADEEPDPVILGIALADAIMTLPKGLAASEVHGRPVSAKFEMPDGELRLSVYIAAADGFVELALDPKTGTVISVEQITDADDLTHANAQKAAMEKATVSLQAAAEKAAHENPDSLAVSVVPERRDGRPIAAVKLLRPRDLITAREPLD
jgi:hypothetical protein